MGKKKTERITITGVEIMANKAGYKRESFRCGCNEPVKYERKTKNKARDRNIMSEYS